MDVRVADHQVDTSESVREYAQQRMAEITQKYFSRAVGANVTFGRGADNGYSCDIVAPVASGRRSQGLAYRARSRRWRSTALQTESKSSFVATCAG